MIWRRSVAPRATACAVLVMVPAARSRLCVMAAQRAQALFAAKRPEGRWAIGPSMRSANTVSMMAWRRWVMSASAVAWMLLEERVVAPLCAGPRYVWVRGVRERLPVGCGAGAFDCFT